MTKTFTFNELSQTGLLWLLNETQLHPRGLALGLLCDDDGNVTGWQISDEYDPYTPELVKQKAEQLAAFITSLESDEHPIGDSPTAELQRQLQEARARIAELEAREQAKPVEPIHNGVAINAPVGAHNESGSGVPVAPSVIPVRANVTPLRTQPRFHRASFAATYKDRESSNVVGGNG